MRQKLCRRLEELEKTNAAAAAQREATKPYDGRALDELIAETNAWHAVPENQAWLAAQPPEFFVNSMRALKAQLEELASGRSRSEYQGGY